MSFDFGDDDFSDFATVPNEQSSPMSLNGFDVSAEEESTGNSFDFSDTDFAVSETVNDLSTEEGSDLSEDDSDLSEDDNDLEADEDDLEADEDDFEDFDDEDDDLEANDDDFSLEDSEEDEDLESDEDDFAFSTAESVGSAVRSAEPQVQKPTVATSTYEEQGATGVEDELSAAESDFDDFESDEEDEDFGSEENDFDAEDDEFANDLDTDDDEVDEFEDDLSTDDNDFNDLSSELETVSAPSLSTVNNVQNIDDTVTSGVDIADTSSEFSFSAEVFNEPKVKVQEPVVQEQTSAVEVHTVVSTVPLKNFRVVKVFTNDDLELLGCL